MLSAGQCRRADGSGRRIVGLTDPSLLHHLLVLGFHLLMLLEHGLVLGRHGLVLGTNTGNLFLHFFGGHLAFFHAGEGLLVLVHHLRMGSHHCVMVGQHLVVSLKELLVSGFLRLLFQTIVLALDGVVL